MEERFDFGWSLFSCFVMTLHRWCKKITFLLSLSLLLLLLYFSIRMGDLVYLCRWLLPFLGHHRKKKTKKLLEHLSTASLIENKKKKNKNKSEFQQGNRRRRRQKEQKTNRGRSSFDPQGWLNRDRRCWSMMTDQDKQWSHASEPFFFLFLYTVSACPNCIYVPW